MPTSWIHTKSREFLVELVDNFCNIHVTLNTEFVIYQAQNTVCFERLAQLLGQENNQGRLWRLKDTAHLLFRSFDHTPLSGRFLDWSIGYLFHECMKLKEDAYQSTYYVPWFQSVEADENLTLEERAQGQELLGIASQTAKSIDREVARIQAVLALCRRLFITYLPTQKDNILLARFLYTHSQKVQSVFGSETETLLQAIYGSEPHSRFLLAAISLRQGGWMEAAAQALERAMAHGLQDERLLQEKKIIDQKRKKGYK